MSNYKKSHLSIYITLIIAIVGGIVGSYANYYFLEQTTDTELRLFNVNFEKSYRLIENNETEILELTPQIFLYNDIKSSYPATLFPPNYQIIDNENLEIINNITGGLDKSIVLPGETVTIYGWSPMELIKSGNYTFQVTIYYLDPKSGETKIIEFYNDFLVYPNDDSNKNTHPYYAKTQFVDSTTRWKYGQKYPSDLLKTSSSHNFTINTIDFNFTSHLN